MFSHLSRPKLLRTLAGITVLALSSAAGALVAQQPDPIPPAAPVVAPVATPQAAPASSAPAAPAKGTAISDVALARSVLAALDADPVLKDVNLVVSVVDRGVVIGGPVASDNVKRRVESVVRGVPGIESVKNLCFVHADPDPLMRAVAERMKPNTKPAAPAALPGVALGPSAPEGALPPVQPLQPIDLFPGTKASDTVAAKPQLPPVGLLGAPVAVGPATNAKVSPLPTIPAPAAPAPLPTAPGSLTGSNPAPAKPADVHAAALAVRDSTPRYARLTVELKPDGTLFVSGSAKKDDVIEFVTEVKKIPGVGRVAVDPFLVR